MVNHEPFREILERRIRRDSHRIWPDRGGYLGCHHRRRARARHSAEYHLHSRHDRAVNRQQITVSSTSEPEGAASFGGLFHYNPFPVGESGLLETVSCLARVYDCRMGKRVEAIPTANKYKEYVLYAEHCLAMAKVAPSKEARIIQREMAAEWLKLAEQTER
jgi:hypothetical protein